MSRLGVIEEFPQCPPRKRLNCEHCNRNRFYVYRMPSGRVILACYSCGVVQEVDGG